MASETGESLNLMVDQARTENIQKPQTKVTKLSFPASDSRHHVLRLLFRDRFYRNLLSPKMVLFQGNGTSSCYPRDQTRAAA